MVLSRVARSFERRSEVTKELEPHKAVSRRGQAPDELDIRERH